MNNNFFLIMKDLWESATDWHGDSDRWLARMQLLMFIIFPPAVIILIIAFTVFDLADRYLP